MDSHVCDPGQPDCAAHLHYASEANRRPAEGAAGRRSRPRRLDRHVPVRFEADVISRVKAVALRDGLTVSSWIRRLVARELDAPRPAGTYNDGAARSSLDVTYRNC